MEPALIVRDVRKRFGGVVALDGVTLGLRHNEVTGIVGPNGAGKTTLVNVITGLVRPDGGEIYLKDRRLTGLPPHAIARMGISRTFQIPRLFWRMSLMENMITASMYRGPGGDIYSRAEELLSLVGLKESAEKLAFELSGGQQKLLEFARALMPDPDVILMDEPFAGVHPSLIPVLIDSIKEALKLGKTLLIISHETPVLAEVADRMVLMHLGRIILEGSPDEVLSAKKTVEIYMGMRA